MNVYYHRQTIAAPTLTVQILLEVSNVFVTVDIVEMDLCAEVCK